VITEAVQQLAGLFSRRFFFNALLPTFIFATLTASTVVLANSSAASLSDYWAGGDLATRLLSVFAYVLIVYFLAAGVSNQWRNIVRLYEGYPLKRLAHFTGRPAPGERWHQSRQERLLSDEHGDEMRAYYRYPHESFSTELLPTRLGNILLAGERYADVRYGIDTIYFWPRLYPLLPATLQADLEEAVIQYQFPLVTSFLAAISTVIAGCALVGTSGSASAFLSVVLVGSGLAYGAYLSSLPSAIELANYSGPRSTYTEACSCRPGLRLQT